MSVSSTFLAHYFFNKFRFYCSCFYLSMLLFRVFFNYIICYFFLKLILDAQKKKEVSVGFFNHFRKDFIHPYGLAHDSQSFEVVTLSQRMNNLNCEFYIRSQIAISEFVETVSVNLKYMEENMEILQPKPIEAFLKKAKKVEKYLALLDLKQTGETGKSIYYNFC